MKKFKPSEVEIRRIAEEDVIRTSGGEVTDDYFTDDNWWGTTGEPES